MLRRRLGERIRRLKRPGIRLQRLVERRQHERRLEMFPGRRTPTAAVQLQDQPAKALQDQVQQLHGTPPQSHQQIPKVPSQHPSQAKTEHLLHLTPNLATGPKLSSPTRV
ncbi:hypothetical protein FOQG_05444 [Fusarium oxysporum f. sp. raphani 54005]|uniref:Uncharacterized protein n=1 Tax=Fusarium oxysporum f. sp. raphani 54005 TaxID=1089458 RepID=X0CFY4_FUSOX|nr:hypothetical protein FOQG_05444 [Fusarium oxysporum f. sp. raphani 54005]